MASKRKSWADKKTEKVSVRLTPADLAWLKSASQVAGCSMSTLVREGFWQVIRQFDDESIRKVNDIANDILVLKGE